MSTSPGELETRKQRLHATLARLSGRYAFSQPVALPLLFLLTLGTMFADSERTNVYSDQWIWVGIISGVISYLYFTIFGACVDRPTRQRFAARSVLALFLFASTETLRAITVATLAAHWGLTEDVNWAFRITASACTGLVLFTLTSILVNDSREFRAISSQLLDSQTHLKQALESTQLDIERRREQLLQSVRDAVHTALKAIAVAPGASAASARETVRELNRVSDEVIRPLSHALHLGAVTTPGNAAKANFKVDFRSVIRNASINQPFRPEATAIITFLLLVGQALFGGRLWTGVILLSAGVVLIYVSLVLLRKFAVPRLRKMRLSGRIIFILISYLLIGVVFGSLLGLGWWSAGPNVVLLISVYAVFIAMPVFSLIGVTPGIRAVRESVIINLENVNAQLRHAKARLNAELVGDRRAIARSLHRDVQGVLVAAALRLEKQLDQGVEVDDATAEVRELIEMAANFSTAPQPVPAYRAIVESITERWQGVLGITFTAADNAIAALNDDALLRGSFLEVVSEFMTNSVRHGHAQQASVTMLKKQPQSLELQLRNDGRAVPAAESANGLGMQLISSLATQCRWVDTLEPDVCLLVELPLG